ncbi:MAG TPA: YggT family protein [Acidimicrobiales bacterium]|nr:YggT family protein [Acidimicrobiales bacterium]
MQQLILMILQVYLLCVFGRIILSWFPVNPGSPVATVSSFLYSITEPILGPIRNALPRVGMFDLSPIVVIFGIQILMRVIQRSM